MGKVTDFTDQTNSFGRESARQRQNVQIPHTKRGWDSIPHRVIVPSIDISLMFILFIYYSFLFKCFKPAISFSQIHTQFHPIMSMQNKIFIYCFGRSLWSFSFGVVKSTHVAKKKLDYDLVALLVQVTVERRGLLSEVGSLTFHNHDCSR